MITITRREALIAAPVDNVFSYAINMENYSQWFPGVLRIVSIDDMPCERPGKRYQEQLELNGESSSLEIMVQVCEHNRLFVTHGNLQPLLPQMRMEFDRQEENCHFVLSFCSRNPALQADSDLILTLSQELGLRAEQGLERLGTLLADARSG